MRAGLACLTFLTMMPLVAPGCKSARQTADPPPDPSQPAALSSAFEVRRGAVTKHLILDGELRAARSRTIFTTSYEEVKITYLPPEGSFVQEGDRLVELDSGTVLNKIRDIEERIVAADNEVLQMQSAHESALRDMAVELSRLWLAYEQAKVKAAIPADLIARRDYQENQLALEKARTEYENHQVKIEQKKKEQAADLRVKVIERQKLDALLKQASGELGGMLIRAPAEGIVLYTDNWMEEGRKLQVGDLVWSGLPLVRLPDLRQMEVYAVVNEVDGPKLSVGLPAQIRLDSHPERVIRGTIEEIAQTAIRATRVAKIKIFRVLISLQETDPEVMRPGMSAQVFAILGECGPGLLVPRAAMRFESGTPTVLRVEKEAERPIAVTILGLDATHYVVADNGALKEGDRIKSRLEN